MFITTDDLRIFPNDQLSFFAMLTVAEREWKSGMMTIMIEVIEVMVADTPEDAVRPHTTVVVDVILTLGQDLGHTLLVSIQPGEPCD